MSRRKYTIDQMQELAAARDGECLSTGYRKLASDLLWRCEFGHTWVATPASIIAGTWCPECNDTTLTIDEMRQAAAERGGRCLSDTYTNSTTPLRWACRRGHTWRAIPSSIKAGSWCPYCNERREEVVRQILERSTGYQFPKGVFSQIVDGKKVRRFELDGYCPALQLAFEYDGRQHSAVTPSFITGDTAAKLAERRQRDAIKDQLCRRHGVRLLRIPYTVRYRNLAAFIRQGLAEFGIYPTLAESN